MTDCPVESAIQIIGGKWKLLLLRVLIVDGPQRFNALLKRVHGISAKVLTQNLRELEDDCVVERDGPSYRVTDAGAALQPILHALGEWTASLTEPTRAPREAAPPQTPRTLRAD